MADYDKIHKNGWTCVQGKLGILCHHDDVPTETVSFNGSVVKIVDAESCETRKTITGRNHTSCKFRGQEYWNDLDSRIKRDIKEKERG